LPQTGIRIRYKQALLDRCWSHRIPILSGAETRNWLDSGASLPPPSPHATAFDDRRAFEKQPHQGCAG